MKTAIITPPIVNPEHLYGAERHYVGMVQAFRKKVETEWIQVPVSEYNWETVLQGYLDCYELDLSRFDVVVSTKNPTYMAQHDHHVCWLLHQMRVFYDRFDDEYGGLPAQTLAELRQQREVVHRLDTLGLRQVRHIFTNGHETARRLKFYNGFRCRRAASSGLRQRSLLRLAGLLPASRPAASLEAGGLGVARHAARQGGYSVADRGHG